MMKRTPRAHLNVEAQTHAGMTGKNNEDRYAVASFTLASSERTPVLFAVLADGIGGHRAGEVAATYATRRTQPARRTSVYSQRAGLTAARVR